MTDDSMSKLVDLIFELAKLREQKAILLRLLEQDDFHMMEKDEIRRIFDVEVKNDI